MAPAVAIAVFNQLEELNSVIGNFFTYNDAAAQTLPNWMKVQEFLQVTINMYSIELVKRWHAMTCSVPSIR